MTMVEDLEVEVVREISRTTAPQAAAHRTIPVDLRRQRHHSRLRDGDLLDGESGVDILRGATESACETWGWLPFGKVKGGSPIGRLICGLQSNNVQIAATDTRLQKVSPQKRPRKKKSRKRGGGVADWPLDLDPPPTLP